MEWQGAIDRKWNSERPLVFAHLVLTKKIGARKAREIRARIDRQLDLCERGIHAGLVVDALAESRDQEGRVERRVEQEEDRLVCSFYSTVLLVNLRQAVRQATGREGRGGSIILGYVYTKTGKPVTYVLQEKHSDMRVPPVENPTCAAFKEYEEVPEILPLDFS